MLPAGFPLEHVYDELYFPMFDRLRKGTHWHNFADAVRRGVAALTYQFTNDDPLPILRETLLKAGQSLCGAEKLAAQNICLSCLSCTPTGELSCGHRICDRCIERYRSADGTLTNCLLCNATNDLPVRPKPLNTGVRLLRLSGRISEAFGIYRFLQSLRSKLRIPLYECFDLVLASGVGIFFTLMIFCKQASLEDCLYHLPHIKYLKIGRSGFHFNKHLRFRCDELHSNLTRISLGACDIRSEAERLFPGCKIDAILDCYGGSLGQIDIVSAAETLLASLFYVDDISNPVPGQGGIVRVALKCRLPPGPELANLALRLRTTNARIWFGNNSGDRTELCDAATWRRIRAGEPFRKSLLVKVDSAITPINVQISTSDASTTYRASNCPLVVADQIKTVRKIICASGTECRNAEHNMLDTLDEMERQLRQIL